MYLRFKALLISHAQFSHALRVTLAIAFTLAFYSVIHVPHSMWGPVTVVVVMMQPYAGAIVYKGFQRIGGTLLGAILGLLTVLFPDKFDYLIPAWMLAWVFLLSLKSYGKNIYFFFLAVMTLIIVSYQGDTALEVSVALWRVANILIGSLIAIAFSLLLPIRAITSWNTLFNQNLRALRQLYQAHASAHMLSIKQLNSMKREVLERHMKMIILLPNVQKERHKLAGHYRTIITVQRSLISVTEQLIETHWSSDISRRQLLAQTDLKQYQQHIITILNQLEQASTNHSSLMDIDTLPDIDILPTMAEEILPNDTANALGIYAYFWLTRQFISRLDALIIQLRIINQK
ncbi:FUSC family protein [Photobacterium toruni]|uniref:FUSC family protein n=1 Tax=Photobacterium toruni TaxID=1935446 RepID=UPI002E1903C8|nr:FUSC family protein [Photobacterium toruni]